MKAKPIIFRADMIRALLREIERPGSGKRQTRRVVKLPVVPTRLGQWEATTLGGAGITDAKGRPVAERAALWHTRTGVTISCPYGQAGDLLWCKENWAARLDEDHLKPRELGCTEVGYWADGPGRCCNTGCPGAAGKVRSARFMPRRFSRITLLLTDVRIERIQSISNEDAVAEGIGTPMDIRYAAVDGFRPLWESIHGPDAWDRNEWVWALTFRVIRANVDAILAQPERYGIGGVA